MKLIQVDAKYLKRWKGRPAATATCCSRAVRVGQWVFHHRFDAVAFAQTDVHLHAACLKARLADVPEDTVVPTDPAAAERAFDRQIEALRAASAA